MLLESGYSSKSAVTHEHFQGVTNSTGAYHHPPVCEHGVEPFVFELPVEVGSDVSLRVEHLQTHAAKHTMKPWQKKQQLLHKPVEQEEYVIHFETGLRSSQDLNVVHLNSRQIHLLTEPLELWC